MLIKLGRSLFGIAIAFFGIQHFIYMLNVKGPIAGPPWIVGRPFWAYLMGAVLVIAGVSIVARVKVRLAGISLAALLFLYVLFLYVPGLLTHIHDPGRWTSAAELVAMSGAAMVLAGSNGIERTHRPSNSITNDIGRLLFAIPFVVFGIQHLLYANFVAMLVPSWIPGHLFWAYFIGIAFIAASLSMATKIKGQWAATLLGIMFSLFVITLHTPRIAGAVHNGNEWTSGFVALAMAGGAFVVAGVFNGAFSMRSK